MKKLLAKILVVVMVSLTVLNTGVISSFAEIVDEEIFAESFDAEEEAFLEGMLKAEEGAKVAQTEEEFEASLVPFKEYPGYEALLRQLHSKYPGWKFVCDKTGRDWNEAVGTEIKALNSVKRNLVDSTDSKTVVNWRSLEYGDYNWTTGKWKGYDGDIWIAASKAIVAYEMDPRAYLQLDGGTSGLPIYKAVFQFLDEPEFDKNSQTILGIKKVFEGSFLNGNIVYGENKKSAVAMEDHVLTACDDSIELATVEITENSEIAEASKSECEEMIETEATVSEATDSDAIELDESTEEQVGTDSIAKQESEQEGNTEIVKEETCEEITLEEEETLTATTPTTYAELVLQLAEKYDVNAYYLASALKQEQGTKVNDMISGNYPGYVGYYNYFNVGASGATSAQVKANGLSKAKQMGWDTPEKAIEGGISFFKENYLSQSQSTIYYKKFNVKAGTASPYAHQYMQNVRGAWGEGNSLGKAYTYAYTHDESANSRDPKANNAVNGNYTFTIPVFENMPRDICHLPNASHTPGCGLESLKVNGKTVSGFNVDNYIYKYTVSNSTKSVNVTYTTQNSNAKAELIAQEKTKTLTNLAEGDNVFEIMVSTDNGYWQSYYIDIFRERKTGGGGNTPSSPSTKPSSNPSSGPSGTDSPKQVTQVGGTFSKNWYQDAAGLWRIKNNKGGIVTNAWLCDDVVAGNGQNVWYLLQGDGSMLFAGLVQDNSGNFYSLETTHNGYYGMLRYVDGYYDCNGQRVYLQFSKNHNGSFGAVINADGLAKLKQIYGVTRYYIGNENIVYTTKF